MKTIIATILLTGITLPGLARVTVARSAGSVRSIDLVAVDERLSVIIAALRPYLASPVQILLGEADPRLTFRGKGLLPTRALESVAAEAAVLLRFDGRRFWVEARRAHFAVSLDVKDADLRVILEDMRKQCGIRNLVLDRDVQGSGTFLFRDVPCKSAFDIVLRTNGLQMIDTSEAVTSIGRQR